MLFNVCRAVGLLILLASPATAAIYSQNFDGLNLSTINGQDGWFADGVGGANGQVQNTSANPGQALQVLTGGTSGRAGSFDTVANSPLQKLTFDLMIPFTINDVLFADAADIQHQIQIRGPAVNQNMFVVYKGAKNPNQNPATPPSPFNSLSFRGGSPTQDSSFSPQSGVWYTIEIDYDFAGLTFDGLIKQGNTVIWDPVGGQLFSNDGNTNFFAATADGDFNGFEGNTANLTVFIDNLSIVAVPEPATATLVALAMVGLRSFRRRRYTVQGS